MYISNKLSENITTSTVIMDSQLELKWSVGPSKTRKDGEDITGALSTIVHARKFQLPGKGRSLLLVMSIFPPKLICSQYKPDHLPGIFWGLPGNYHGF